MGKWAFGGDDADIDTGVPPGFRYANAIDSGMPFGKLLSCRSCGALVAVTDNAINRHRTFHNRLGGNLDMNYSQNNPNIIRARAETASVGVINVHTPELVLVAE